MFSFYSDFEKRSRSPRFSGDEFRISNDTQRNETHLKRARLFVGNIEPDAVSRKDLLDTFSRYGDVIAVSIHNGYAFVQMDSEKNANAAVNLENGRSLNGKKISMAEARLHPILYLLCLFLSFRCGIF